MRYLNPALRTLISVGAVAAVSAAAALIGMAPAAAVGARPRLGPSFNGTVFAVAYRGDTVYVGGSFSRVSAGGSSVARARLAAFSARTGKLLNWKPSVNGTVKALAVYGTSVYAAGTFGTVSGRRRDSLVRIDARSGAVGSFAHSVSGEAVTLAVGSGRLYVGGDFKAVDGARRGNLAAFSLRTGALDRRWTPRTDDRVYALAAARSRIYVGGNFHRVNRVPGSMRLAAVAASNGALVRGFRPRPPAIVRGIAVNRRAIFAATGGSGGRAVAYRTNGRVLWTHLFDGDAHAITTLGGIVYVGGHFDRACRTTSRITQKGCTAGYTPRVKLAALNARGALTRWNPRANGVVGVRALVPNTVRRQLGVGGEFTRIAGAARQRYAAFE